MVIIVVEAKIERKKEVVGDYLTIIRNFIDLAFAPGMRCQCWDAFHLKNIKD